MIKRIIFDLDNTLIKWEKEYDNSVIRAYQKFNIEIDDNKLEQFNNVLRKYEKENNTFDIKLMTNFFNKNYNLGMPNKFIEVWLDELEKCIPNDYDNLKEVLEYLSSKYTLIILTNWFTKSQAGRLKNMGLLKYFNKVIGADQVIMKPAKEAFIYAKEDDNYDECIMIGDDIKIDLEVPKLLGMRTILVSNSTTSYEEKIDKIERLKEML